jgi:hypothetical protein
MITLKDVISAGFEIELEIILRRGWKERYNKTLEDNRPKKRVWRLDYQ